MNESERKKLTWGCFVLGMGTVVAFVVTGNAWLVIPMWACIVLMYWVSPYDESYW